MTKVVINGNPDTGFQYHITASSGRPVLKSFNSFTRKRDAVRSARNICKEYFNSVADIQDNAPLFA